MIRIAVASGKGGTGKTTVATSLAVLLARGGSVHFLDCDVEAPNGSLFLRPVIDVTEQVTRLVPVIDESVCDHRGGCALVCPKRAISETPRSIGQMAEGSAGTIRFTQGMLNTGETATVHLIQVVLSGKGGTGKTSLTAVFATLMSEAVLVDCDVDAANLHLLLDPLVEERHDFAGGAKARVNSAACNGCGLCAGVCRFDSVCLEGIIAAVNLLHCEGCGVCAQICPATAITIEAHVCGQPERSALILVDGPPGAGCPVISSLTGADYAVMVTEPTLSGYSDLQRAVAVADHFRVPTGIIINKADINPDIASRIEDYAAATGRDSLGRIGYDPAFTRAQRSGSSVLDTAAPLLRSSLEGAWRAVERAVQEERSPFAVVQ